MSDKSEAIKREMRQRSLDTILVHNPSNDDYIMWDDKYGPTSRKIVVPNCKKDVGYGKGNSQLPCYIAKRYARRMIESIITKIADDAWAKKKKEYRTRDEMLQHAPLEGIRTNDKKLWDEYAPKIWLGVVTRYGGEDLPDPVEALIPDSGDPLKDTFKELNLEDKVYEPTTETI